MGVFILVSFVGVRSLYRTAGQEAFDRPGSEEVRQIAASPDDTQERPSEFEQEDEAALDPIEPPSVVTMPVPDVSATPDDPDPQVGGGSVENLPDTAEQGRTEAPRYPQGLGGVLAAPGPDRVGRMAGEIAVPVENGFSEIAALDVNRLSEMQDEFDSLTLRTGIVPYAVAEVADIVAGLVFERNPRRLELQARAAFLRAQALGYLDDWRGAVMWAERAANLAPGNEEYQLRLELARGNLERIPGELADYTRSQISGSIASIEAMEIRGLICGPCRTIPSMLDTLRSDVSGRLLDIDHDRTIQLVHELLAVYLSPEIRSDGMIHIGLSDEEFADWIEKYNARDTVNVDELESYVESRRARR